MKTRILHGASAGFGLWLAALLLLAFTGCAHPPAAGLVSVTGLVEDFEPESLVFYQLNSGLPYDARSRIAQVRVLEPQSLAGRRFSIDLLSDGEKKDAAFPDLQRKGATVRFLMPSDLAGKKENELIPVDLLQPK